MSGRYGGPPDGGLTVGMTEFARRLDDAREEFVETAREESVSPLVRAMCEALAGVAPAPVPQAPETPGAAAEGLREIGWSARRGRRA